MHGLFNGWAECRQPYAIWLIYMMIRHCARHGAVSYCHATTTTTTRTADTVSLHDVYTTYTHNSMNEVIPASKTDERYTIGIPDIYTGYMYISLILASY